VTVPSRALLAFDRLGFCLLPGAIEPRQVDALEAALRLQETAPDAERPPHAPRSFTPVVNEVRVLNVVECGPAFEELVDLPVVLDWVRALVPGPPRLTAAQSITRGTGVGLPLHRIDGAYVADGRSRRCEHLTAVVWLCDVGPEDGPLVAFSGSHRSDEPLPCPAVHPGWTLPRHDSQHASAFLQRQEAAPPVPWEAVPGYHEFHVRRGDVVLFAESLLHGAREVRSQRLRRSLYYSYAPYHCTNWHGLTYSPELLARVTPARRELLSGPFIGSRYDVWPVNAPDLPEFPRLPESELGPRPIGPVPDAVPPEARARVRYALTEAVRRHAMAPAELDGVEGRLHLCADEAGEWTLELAGGRLRVRPGLGGQADARLELPARDLEGLFRGEGSAVALFNAGRARLRGDLRLAMRLASFLFP